MRPPKVLYIDTPAAQSQPLKVAAPPALVQQQVSTVKRIKDRFRPRPKGAPIVWFSPAGQGGSFAVRPTSACVVADTESALWAVRITRSGARAATTAAAAAAAAARPTGGGGWLADASTAQDGTRAGGVQSDAGARRAGGVAE